MVGAKKVSTGVISDPNKLLKIKGVWSTLMDKCPTNPIFLIGFVKQLMEFNRSKGWTPFVLVISADNMIIGIVPLMTKKKFGVRFAKFLLKSSYSPDFIVDNQYRETCIAYTLDFLFKTLRCQFVDFAFQLDSPSLRVLQQKCKANRICVRTKPEVGHCIIPIENTWDEFKRLRGRNFRKKFKKIERDLGRAGSWRIECIENRNDGSEALERILDVERMSWKESWRAQRGEKIDESLLLIWKGSQYTARIEPNFEWNVLFLELNNQTIAYALVLQYKEVAFIIKTSYNERHKRLYPGIYVINAAIRELYNKKEVRNIDFLTELPFHRTWTSLCLSRVDIVMTKGILPTIIGSLYTNTHLRRTLRVFLDLLPIRRDHSL